jgi:hypothetical protein
LFIFHYSSLIVHLPLPELRHSAMANEQSKMNNGLLIAPQNVLHPLKPYKPHKSPLRTLKAESHDCEATIDLNRG